MIFKGLKKLQTTAIRGLRHRMIDSFSVRAHHCADGSLRDDGPREIGRFRGGRTTNIYAMADGKGGLRRMRLSPGQAADRAEAAALLGRRCNLHRRPPPAAECRKADDSVHGLDHGVADNPDENRAASIRAGIPVIANAVVFAGGQATRKKGIPIRREF